MREPDPHSNASDRSDLGFPPIGPWDLVSDPFERPKLYRHKTPLITDSVLGRKVYLFVIERRGVTPILLHDMGESLAKPELRLLIDNEPIEVGCVGRVPRKNSEGFIDFSPEDNEWTMHRHGMYNCERIPEGVTAIPFRLKFAQSAKSNPDEATKRPNYSLFVTPTPPPTLRGVIEGPALIALRQAIQLSASFNQ